MPWGPAAATGVGSMPGTDPAESARIVTGELPGFVHVVELPARGPGADMVGRTAGMITRIDAGWGLETTPGGWRVAGARSRQMRQAWALLGEDLDALEEVSVGYRGPVKCQVVGPWTMAASVELPSGERVLRDPGAVDDLAQALAEAVGEHVMDLRRRLPAAAAVVVQLDEPALPAVLEGRIGTASGLSSYAAVDPQVAERVLGWVMRAGGADGVITGMHCCAVDAPVGLALDAGARFVSIDITGADEDSPRDAQVGRLLEGGGGLIAGSVPSIGSGQLGSGQLSDAAVSRPVRQLLHRLGLEDDRHLNALAISPTCGLAGASPQWARTALSACTAVGRVLRQDEASEVPDGS